jgi:hypothetical protein
MKPIQASLLSKQNSKFSETIAARWGRHTLGFLTLTSLLLLSGCGEANREIHLQDSTTSPVGQVDAQSSNSPAPTPTQAVATLAPSVSFFGYYEAPFEAVWDAPLAQQADYEIQVCRLNTSLTTSPFQVADESNCRKLGTIACEGRQTCIALNESNVEDPYARLQSSAVNSQTLRTRYSNSKWAAVSSIAFIRIRAKNSLQLGAWVAPTTCSTSAAGGASGSKTCTNQ